MSGRSWIEEHGCVVTVELVTFTILDGDLCVLVERRREAPYRGRWALPSLVLTAREDVDGCARRLLDSHLETTGAELLQLQAYASPRRHPGRRTVAVAWVAVVGDLDAHVESSPALWMEVQDATQTRLGFDHDAILRDALDRLRHWMEHKTIATKFCSAQFTVAQLRQVYEVIWQTDLDPANFHRKVTGVAGFLVPTTRQTEGTRGRPAQYYRLGEATELSPPVPRPRH